MKEPLYRWVCTICGISEGAESSEMARLNVDAHVQILHPSARAAVRVHPDPAWDRLVQERRDQDEDAARGPGDDEDGPGGQD